MTDTLALVQANTLLDVVAYTLAKVDVETLVNTLSDVKAKYSLTQ